MQHLNLSRKPDAPLNVLCLGAHSDDIEIGCGGTILTLLQNYRDTSIYWVVLGADEEERAAEALRSAEMFLAEASQKKVVVKRFRSSFFPYVGESVKSYFEELKGDFSPDLIFTHYRDDLHQDHRLINELTWNTFRSHMILEYEIPKYDGDLGNPNVFVHLDSETVERKISDILAVFKTQGVRHWFTADAFQAILRLRGIESAAPGKFAEAFHCRKAVLL